MCGLAGFAGLNDAETRFRLVLALGAGIDNRGGHAAGYVSLAGNQIRFAKRAGEWSTARYRFILSASRADICLMHARFATCGDKDAVLQAHPFAIKRDGKVKLWGAHNGMIFDAWESAAWHDREDRIDVDSQELFELIADEEYDTLRHLEGYGVATWINAGENHVNLVRLSEYSEICVVRVKGGGIVWGSTWGIVSDACEEAKLDVESEFDLDEVGRVYQIFPGQVLMSANTGVKVADSFKFTSMSKSKFSEDDADFMKEMEALDWGWNNTYAIKKKDEETGNEEGEEKDETDPFEVKEWGDVISRIERDDDEDEDDDECYSRYLLRGMS